MDGVELDLRLLDLDAHLGLEVRRRHRLQLAGSVGGEAAPLRPIVQHQTLRKKIEEQPETLWRESRCSVRI